MNIVTEQKMKRYSKPHDCDGCGYYRQWLGLCVYILVEGHSRPCKPGLACTCRTAEFKQDPEDLKEQRDITRILKELEDYRAEQWCKQQAIKHMQAG